ncbi:MAG: DUF2281 domain-containing protein [Leptolyngbyaceae cyanobacterium]|mgnify:CR=1 FL=1
MTTRELILKELEQLPETLLKTVLDFLTFLKPKQSQTADNPWTQFVGILDDAEAKEIQEVITQEFEYIELNA